LLWAIPQSDLARSAALIASGSLTAKAKSASMSCAPEMVWAPLVDHGGASPQRVRTIAAYSVLNSHPSVHARWGLTPETLTRLRQLLVGGGASAAQDLVPAQVLDDLIVSDSSPAAVARVAASIGATSLAVPAFSIAEVEARVTWARLVLSAIPA
jgi:hypothetical protein